MEDTINNEFYNNLGDDWYLATDHAIALLRAENRVRSTWICDQIKKRKTNCTQLLDVGCGGGLFSNIAAKRGHEVTGIDLSESSLHVAKKHDATGKVNYIHASAYELPFSGGSFDVVTALDILEHVESPRRLIHEAARVLKPGGLFFYHTFNRNLLSYLVVIQGIKWFVKNSPKNIHLYSYFLKPKEVQAICKEKRLKVTDVVGLSPNPFKKSFWQLVVRREVPDDFPFFIIRSTAVGYTGIAVKH